MLYSSLAILQVSESEIGVVSKFAGVCFTVKTSNLSLNCLEMVVIDKTTTSADEIRSEHVNLNEIWLPKRLRTTLTFTILLLTRMYMHHCRHFW